MSLWTFRRLWKSYFLIVYSSARTSFSWKVKELNPFLFWIFPNHPCVTHNIIASSSLKFWFDREWNRFLLPKLNSQIQTLFSRTNQTSILLSCFRVQNFILMINFFRLVLAFLKHNSNDLDAKLTSKELNNEKLPPIWIVDYSTSLVCRETIFSWRTLTRYFVYNYSLLLNKYSCSMYCSITCRYKPPSINTILSVPIKKSARAISVRFWHRSIQR